MCPLHPPSPNLNHQSCPPVCGSHCVCTATARPLPVRVIIIVVVIGDVDDEDAGGRRGGGQRVIPQHQNAAAMWLIRVCDVLRFTGCCCCCIAGCWCWRWWRSNDACNACICVDAAVSASVSHWCWCCRVRLMLTSLPHLSPCSSLCIITLYFLFKQHFFILWTAEVLGIFWACDGVWMMMKMITKALLCWERHQAIEVLIREQFSNSGSISSFMS